MEQQRRFGRRIFLKSAAIAGVGLGLAACVPAAAPSGDQAGAPSSDEVREITVMHGDSTPFVAFNEDFTAETGIKVNQTTFPSGAWSDIMQKFALWSQSGYSGNDLTIADDLIGGMMAANGLAVELSDLDCWSEHEDDVVEGIHTLNSALDGVYRIFYSLDLEPFFHYKELVPEAPKTWDELVTFAKPATNPDEDVWGWRPLNGTGHEFNTVLLMLNQAGADLDTLDDAATLEAFQFMQDWVFNYGITPKSTVNEGYDQISSLSAVGKAGMWWTYTSGYRNALDNEMAVITMENAPAARWPMGPATDNGLIHGWGWMLPTVGEKKDLAVEYLNWFARPEVLKKYVITVGKNPAPYKSLINDPDVIEAVPTLGLPVGWETILEGARFREPIVTKKPVNELWSMFQNIGRFIFSAEKSPEQTQEWAIAEYQRIIADAG